MSGILLVRKLCSWTSVKIHNDIDAGIVAPTDQAVEVCDASTRKGLALLDKIFTDPEANGDADRVETKTLDLANVVLRDPGVPMLLERGIGGVLAKLLDARPLIVETTATHAGKLIRGHPWLDDELGTEIDTADLVAAGKPSIGRGQKHRKGNCG